MTEAQFLNRLGFKSNRPSRRVARYVSHSIGGIEIVLDNGKPGREKWTAYGAGFECDDGMYITDALEGLIQGLIDEGLLSEDLPILGFFDELESIYP